jgi:hypothetical protein
MPERISIRCFTCGKPIAGAEVFGPQGMEMCWEHYAHRRPELPRIGGGLEEPGECEVTTSGQ